MSGEGHEWYMRILMLSHWFPGGMWVLVMGLVGYGSNNNSLRAWEKVDWMACHSYWKHLHQRLLPVIHQFSEPGW